MSERVSVPIRGLGLTVEAMLELVNRLNLVDVNRKWVIDQGQALEFEVNPYVPNLF